MDEHITYSFWFCEDDQQFCLCLINCAVVLFWQDPSDCELVRIHQDIHPTDVLALKAYRIDIVFYTQPDTVLALHHLRNLLGLSPAYEA